MGRIIERLAHSRHHCCNLRTSTPLSFARRSLLFGMHAPVTQNRTLWILFLCQILKSIHDRLLRTIRHKGTMKVEELKTIEQSPHHDFEFDLKGRTYQSLGKSFERDNLLVCGIVTLGARLACVQRLFVPCRTCPVGSRYGLLSG
jgi:hypothetical protein